MRKKCHGLIILAVIICVVVNYQVAYSADVLSSVYNGSVVKTKI